MLIYHGSPVIVSRPLCNWGKLTNDYGQGFYCTPDKDLACEWACPRISQNGYCNSYELETNGLRVFDLDRCEGGVLSWIATLMKHRKVSINGLGKEEMDAFIAAYAVDLSGFDVVEGYRADDSYFQIVRSFVSNSLSLESLDACLRLGNLGRQIALRTEAAIAALTFVDAQKVYGTCYYPNRAQRNEQAAACFLEIRNEQTLKDGIYFIDVVRDLL